MAIAACSKEKPGAVAKDGSVTVKHLFGETKIAAPPKRVVSAGFTEQDDLLAVGVVPIAITNWWGDQPFGVWPWALPRLGDAKPDVLSLADGIDVDNIAALKPDLIVATNAGLDQDTYNKLSQIAPTIAQSGQEAFFEPWKDQAAAISKRCSSSTRWQGSSRASTTSSPRRERTTRSSQARRCSCSQGALVDDNAHVLTPGWRSEFLTQMGLVVPDNTGGSAPSLRATTWRRCSTRPMC